jgi:hypothetical protein
MAKVELRNMVYIDPVPVSADHRFKVIIDHEPVVGEMAMGMGTVVLTKADVVEILEAIADSESIIFQLEIMQRSQSIDEPISQMDIEFHEEGVNFSLYSVVWWESEGEGYNEELFIG